MKNIVIPKKAEDYRADILKRAFPEERIRENNFYQRLIGWVIDHRTPLLYTQDHDSEYANFSINFNWLLLRDYTETKIGAPHTILAMYALHEFTHMTYWLPTRLNELSSAQYADAFTESEYRASNETELLLHYRVPQLRQEVLQGRKIIFDILNEQGIEQPSMQRLCNLRPVLIEDTVLDTLFGNNPENQALMTDIKRFNGNREWATARFNTIAPYFSDPSLPLGDGLTHTEYEDVLSSYEPRLTQEKYEQNIIRNIKLGFAMCGLEVPTIQTFDEALTKAKELEGHHAVVQS